MNRILAAAAVAMALAGPALADEPLSKTPQLALPEPDYAAPQELPHSSITETTPMLALPEPESTPSAPVANCRTGEAVYLTN